MDETVKDEADSKRSKEKWPLAERPGFLARRLHQIHVSLFMEFCGAFRITPLQYSLLTALAELEIADQSTLARLVALDRTTTTGALKRLETRGLIRRLPSERDRRAQECRITREGLALLARMRTPARDAHDATIAKLSEEERTTFMALLARVVAAHAARGTAPLHDN